MVSAQSRLLPGRNCSSGRRRAPPRFLRLTPGGEADNWRYTSPAPPYLFEAKRAAGPRQVDGGDLHVLAEDNRAGRPKRFFSVKNNAQRPIREAWRHSGGARALQAVRVLDLDHNAVVVVIGVGGEDRQTCFGRDRAKPHQRDKRKRRQVNFGHSVVSWFKTPLVTVIRR